MPQTALSLNLETQIARLRAVRIRKLSRFDSMTRRQALRLLSVIEPISARIANIREQVARELGRAADLQA